MSTRTTVITTKTRTVHEAKPLVSNGIVHKQKYETKYVWRNIIIFIYVHLAALYGLYKAWVHRLYWVSVFQVVYGFFGGIGITAGAHRLWAHRSYKANWPLRVLLGIFQTIAFQNHIYEWARDHRVHHKFSETDADPHNAKRGFFFSHMGWLLVRKHPDVFEKGKTVDMSDLEKDFVVVWQRRLYFILMPLLAFYIPTWVSMQLGADGLTAWYATLFRWAFSLNCTWLVNSAAHMWGNKPYDKGISPSENRVVATLAYGEGWHNYHHTFPYDYKAAELGNYSFNYTTGFIDLFAKIGWAYDLKTVSESVIKRRVERTGDGTHEIYGRSKGEEDHKENVWGWGDKDISTCDLKDVDILHKQSEL